MIKGQTVELRDREYVLAPLPLSVIQEVWPHVEKVVSYSGDSTGAFAQLPDILDAAAEVILAAMTHGNNPEMTGERLRRDVLDYANWRTAFFATLAISGIRLQAVEPGKVPELARVPLTGTPST